MISHPPSKPQDDPDSAASQNHAKVLAWLSTQGTPDHGEIPPPLPEDLLKELQDKFGKDPPSIPAQNDVDQQTWLTSLLRRPFLLWGSLAVTACLVLFLSLRTIDPVPTPSTDPSVLRGGPKTNPGVSGDVSWKWIGGEEFAAELAKLGKEGFAGDAADAEISISLDAKSDAQFVLVSGTKNGVAQPDWTLRLSKLPADAKRPNRWLQALLQLQGKIDATP